jgi:predicted nucleic acid-binding protein
MPEAAIADTSTLIALEKIKELKEKGFYVSDELLDDISRFKNSV